MKFRTFIRLELLGGFWIMAVIYLEVLKCSGLCCQLTVCCLFWVWKFKYCWCICQQHRENNCVSLQKSQCVLVTQCSSVCAVLFFPNKVSMCLKHKIIWKCRKWREVTEGSWSCCLSQVASVRLFSPVSQSPSCSGDLVSPVTSQCLAIVWLEFNPLTML